MLRLALLCLLFLRCLTFLPATMPSPHERARFVSSLLGDFVFSRPKNIPLRNALTFLSPTNNTKTDRTTSDNVETSAFFSSLSWVQLRGACDERRCPSNPRLSLSRTHTPAERFFRSLHAARQRKSSRLLDCCSFPVSAFFMDAALTCAPDCGCLVLV